MNFFDPLLGFAVLTGPLWLILILLPVCIWLAIKIAKRFKQRGAKLAGGMGRLRQSELLRLLRKAATAYRHRANRHKNKNRLKEAV